MKDSDVMTRPLAMKAKVVLEKYIDKKAPGGDDVKVALALFLAHIKMMATEAHDDTNRILVTKMLGETSKEKKQHITEIMPHLLPAEEQKKGK